MNLFESYVFESGDWYHDTYEKQTKTPPKNPEKNVKPRVTSRVVSTHADTYVSPPFGSVNPQSKHFDSHPAKSEHEHAHVQTLIHNHMALAKIEHCPLRSNVHVHSLQTKESHENNSWGVPGSQRSDDGKKKKAVFAHHEHTKQVLKAVRHEVMKTGAKTVSTSPLNPKIQSLFLRMGGRKVGGTVVLSSSRFLKRFMHEAYADESANRLDESYRGPDQSELMPSDLRFRANVALVEGGHSVSRWKATCFDQIFEGACDNCKGSVRAFKYARKTTINPLGESFVGSIINEQCTVSLRFKPAKEAGGLRKEYA